MTSSWNCNILDSPEPYCSIFDRQLGTCPPGVPTFYWQPLMPGDEDIYGYCCSRDSTSWDVFLNFVEFTGYLQWYYSSFSNIQNQFFRVTSAERRRYCSHVCRFVSLSASSKRMNEFSCNFQNKSDQHKTLQWRPNERDDASNHKPHDCFLNGLFRRRSKKTSKLRVTGLCEGNSQVTGEFPEPWASNAENVSIWRRHQVPAHVWERSG